MTWQPNEELAATAPDAPAEADPPLDAEALARELAKLPLIEYDRRRQVEAERLGVRVSTLDTEVERHRERPAEVATTEMFPADDPWPDLVRGTELLETLCAALDRFVRFVSTEARDAVALWIMFAHAHDAATISPLLAIESPEKRCGKTTLLSALALLVPRPLPAVNASPSVLFRAVEKYGPTVLIDEADTFLRDDDDLRGILNGGHNRLTAYVLRNVEVGGEYEPRRFNVWAPKALALIGDLADTLQDRAIAIPMRRKLPTETVDRFRADRVAWAGDLRRQAARWAADNVDNIKDADPAVPADLHDRAADNWRAMLAIADLCGWSDRARRAARVLSGAIDGDETPGIMLLSDVRDIMHPDKERTRDTITPRALVEQLVALEDRPWAEWRGGRAISDRSVGRLLAPFGIKSVRTHYGRQFHRSAFEDAWRHYLPPRWWERSVANDTHLKTKGKSEFQTTRTAASRVVCEPENVNEINAVSFATTEQGDGGANVPDDPDEDDFEERAAILEFDGGFSREEAERRARAETEGYHND